MQLRNLVFFATLVLAAPSKEKRKCKQVSAVTTSSIATTLSSGSYPMAVVSYTASNGSYPGSVNPYPTGTGVSSYSTVPYIISTESLSSVETLSSAPYVVATTSAESSSSSSTTSSSLATDTSSSTSSTPSETSTTSSTTSSEPTSTTSSSSTLTDSTSTTTTTSAFFTTSSITSSTESSTSSGPTPTPTFYLKASGVVKGTGSQKNWLPRSNNKYAQLYSTQNSVGSEILTFAASDAAPPATEFYLDDDAHLVNAADGFVLNTYESSTSNQLFWDADPYGGGWAPPTCQINDDSTLSCNIGIMNQFSICFGSSGTEPGSNGVLYLTASPPEQGSSCRGVTVNVVYAP
ncbi:hypothetical protein GGS26DRAFT_602911 [Hypomontagnella submonticulosa]|nr:hypothetical protein GGS26DRAFT_602911 [Hypomontagnella submonticulosa]